VAGAVLLCAGLSIRSLWGSEGRWAVVVREMFLSGNYFLPTINGQVYFDKPLLSYWCIVPFAWIGGITEMAARMPSALAGIGAVLLVFGMGRRLFDTGTGLISGCLLLTTVMFVLWARTASGELLNLISIWCIIWAFMAGGVEGKLKYLLIIYGLGAVSAFLKGPVAPAVSFFVMAFYSIVKAVTVLRSRKSFDGFLAEIFLPQFKWILSWQGVVSAFAGLILFGLFLLLPVIVTGSWESVELMWRENVLRFVKPFDHVEPPYAYVQHTLVFFLPWTCLLLASLWESRKWPADWSYRWPLITGLAIFLFFTISGSRRSYYILPLVPALALITGRALSDWLRGQESGGPGIMRSALLVTAFVPGVAGAALIYAYFALPIARHESLLFLGIGAAAGCGVTIYLLLRRSNAKGFLLLFFLVFILELWSFTGGMAIVEEMRTFRTFCRETNARLTGIDNSRVALYPGGNSSLIFYLNRRGVRTVTSRDELVKFLETHPDGFIIGESKYIEQLKKYDAFKGLVGVLTQKKERYGKTDNDLMLLGMQAK
jgi:4-amino-4-deoxy-L-arabinose transferase-like glycosyltransferase